MTAGGFCGHIAPTIPSSEGLTTVFYLFVLVRLYMILRGIAAKGWGGRQYNGVVHFKSSRKFPKNLLN